MFLSKMFLKNRCCLRVKTALWTIPNFIEINAKEVCNGGVACSLLKLGSLEKTVIASLFYSGLHSGTIFCGKNDVICYLWERQVMPFFDKKKDQKSL